MAEKMAKEIMNKKVITITEDKNLLELAELLIKNKISGVPVVDKKNILKGIVSETDLLDFIKKDETFFPIMMFPNYYLAYVNPDLYLESYEKNKDTLSKTTVETIMKTWVKKAKEDTLESEVADIMIRNKVNRIPIVDDDNKVTGIITRSDLVESMVVRGE